MSGSPSELYWSKIQRGVLLRSTGKWPEAEAVFKEAIAEEVENPLGYYHLAFCYHHWDGHDRQALTTIERAISLNPQEAAFFALRSWILGDLKRFKKALESADQAVALDVGEIFGWNARTRSLCCLGRWKQMEESARSALALEPENDAALNFLAVALRHRGRKEEAEKLIASILSRIPEDPVAQTNAGWSALEAGDHQRANRHFLNALRLNPGFEYARTGLIHSYNARVWFYGWYFALISRLGRWGAGGRVAVVILNIAVYHLITNSLQSRYGEAGDQAGMVVFVLYFCLFIFGRSFANLFLLLDPFARHALTQKEKSDSAFVGLLYTACLSVAFWLHWWGAALFLLLPPACFLSSTLAPRPEAEAVNDPLNDYPDVGDKPKSD